MSRRFCRRYHRFIVLSDVAAVRFKLGDAGAGGVGIHRGDDADGTVQFLFGGRLARYDYPHFSDYAPKGQ